MAICAMRLLSDVMLSDVFSKESPDQEINTRKSTRMKKKEKK